MKRRIQTLAAIGALAAGVALAQTSAPATPQTGAGRAAGVRSRVRQRMLQALNLTDAQKQQAKAIFQATRAQAQPLAQQLKQARQTLEAAVQADNEAAIPQAATAVANLQGQVLTVRAQGMARFVALLTPDQKAKAQEFLQKARQVLGGGGAGLGD